MRILKLISASCIILFFSGTVQAKETRDDSLTLAQAYVNLTLTRNYFDTLSVERLSKILPFEQKELNSIKDIGFIRSNETLYNFTYSLLYLNKARLLFRIKKSVSRITLLQWKRNLDKAISYFNNSNISSYYTVERTQNSFYDLIAFNAHACYQLNRDIEDLKRLFTPYFNRNIYPDFKRIFYRAKNTGRYYFDSLSYYASLYNLPVSMAIKNNLQEPEMHENFGAHNLHVNPEYNLAIALDLISHYLQLKYFIKAASPDSAHPDLYNLYDSYQKFVTLLNPEDSFHFEYDDWIMPKDSFFYTELNKATCDSLHASLLAKFPYEFVRRESEDLAGVSGGYEGAKTKYYFPIPAPFPSAYLYIPNYKPGLTTMKQVDNYFKSIFNRKGYDGHLHYYYVQSGFAVTTSLEKINKDGSPVSGSKRWSVSIGGNGSFSLYETFKSIFFATESNFRIIGLVIYPGKVTVQRSPTSIGSFQDLLTYSYPSLPPDLYDFILPQKALNVLIYDFHQSDIGKVPMLDVSNRLKARNHLERSGLGELLNPR